MNMGAGEVLRISEGQIFGFQIQPELLRVGHASTLRLETFHHFTQDEEIFLGEPFQTETDVVGADGLGGHEERSEGARRLWR